MADRIKSNVDWFAKKNHIRLPKKDITKTTVALAAFAVSLTGLTSGEARPGDHASIGYTIDPDNGTETVAWTYTPGDVDLGTGANPTDYTAGDGGSLVLTVTDGGESVSEAAPIRKQPATGGTDLDLSFAIDTTIPSTDLVANWTTNGNTLSFVSVSPALPFGSISSAGALSGTTGSSAVADDTYTLTMEDEYGREISDTFTLEVTEAASVGDALLLETGDTLLTESGDKLLLGAA